MSGFLLTVAATMSCPHAGQATTSLGNPRVKIQGQPVATMADLSTVAGCVFAPGGAASPCVTVEWLVPAARVMAGAQPVLLQTSTALCANAAKAPQGAPILMADQTRVNGI
ncbi:MAG: hypothetical protein GY719_23080 [bacterium]|nr:hypothetical protein [bacterium]